MNADLCKTLTRIELKENLSDKTVTKVGKIFCGFYSLRYYLLFTKCNAFTFPHM
jgi:hypothetical protein